MTHRKAEDNLDEFFKPGSIFRSDTALFPEADDLNPKRTDKNEKSDSLIFSSSENSSRELDSKESHGQRTHKYLHRATEMKLDINRSTGNLNEKDTLQSNFQNGNVCRRRLPSSTENLEKKLFTQLTMRHLSVERHRLYQSDENLLHDRKGNETDFRCRNTHRFQNDWNRSQSSDNLHKPNETKFHNSDSQSNNQNEKYGKNTNMYQNVKFGKQNSLFPMSPVTTHLSMDGICSIKGDQITFSKSMTDLVDNIHKHNRDNPKEPKQRYFPKQVKDSTELRFSPFDSSKRLYNQDTVDANKHTPIRITFSTESDEDDLSNRSDGSNDGSKFATKLNEKVPKHQSMRNDEYLSEASSHRLGNGSGRVRTSQHPAKPKQDLQEYPSIVYITEFTCHFFEQGAKSLRVTGLAPTQDRHCWVAGENQKSVRLFSSNGKLVDNRYIDEEVDDLVIDKDGNLYMSCPKARCIKFIQAGKMGPFENENYRILAQRHDNSIPRGLSIDPSDNGLVVCLSGIDDESPSNVIKYPSKCTQNYISLTTGRVVHSPTRVAISQNGDIFVSDTGNSSIVKLSKTGKYQEIHRGISDFRQCYGITCDKDGRVIAFSKFCQNAIIIYKNDVISIEVNELDIEDDILSTALDNFGFLWVGCGQNTVKIFEFKA